MTTFRQRLRETEWSRGWGWQMFTANIGTGAVSVVVNSIPYSFRGQHAIGSTFFIINLCLYVFNLTMVAIRAVKHPQVLKASLYDEGEGVWFPVMMLGMATIIIGMIAFGIPYVGSWLIVVAEVLFWVYTFLSAVEGIITQNTLRVLPRPLHAVGPSDCLECFPLMLCGTIGGLLAPQLVKIDPSRALTIVLFSYAMQGLGFFMGLLKMSVWMVHHIVLPRAPAKTLPSYMIAVGPPGFTALALVNLGAAALDVFPANDFMSGLGDGLDATTVARVFSAAGVWFALLLIGMCSWIMLVYFAWGLIGAIRGLKDGIKEGYSMAWWAWTFPLAGFVSTLGKFATYFPSKALGVINIIFVFVIFFAWLVNTCGTLTLLYNGVLPGAPKEYDPLEFDRKLHEDPEKGLRSD